jgi:L-fuconolactonase
MHVDGHMHVWRMTPTFPNAPTVVVSSVVDVPVEVAAEYMEEYGVERAVLIQPVFPGEDNSYVADCAARQPERFAAVCVVDPRMDGAADRLDYWASARGCRGLRLRPHMPEEAVLFGDPATYPLWERARMLGITINVLANPSHLGLLASLANRFPEVALVIDHMGHPNVAAGVHSAGFQSLLYLARFPRVFVKVSGHYAFSQRPYPHSDCSDLFRALYDRFGASRLIWGSDFPHVLLKSGYRRSLLLLQRAYPFLSSQEMAQIMGENAVRLYWQ